MGLERNGEFRGAVIGNLDRLPKDRQRNAGQPPQDWQWIGKHMSQRMFGISEKRAKEYATRYGGEDVERMRRPKPEIKKMETINGIDSIRLAKAFCAEMKNALTADQMSLLIKLNIDEPSDAICHSHDFVDANVVMDEAGKKLGLELCPHEVDGVVVGIVHTEAYTNIWNEAWSLAKRADFDGAMIDEIVKDIQENGY